MRPLVSSIIALLLAVSAAAAQTDWHPAGDRQPIDLQKRTAQLLRSLHPSFLAAVATGENLAVVAPIVQQRLRSTRDAIEALGTDDLAEGSPSAPDYAYISSAEDRRQLIRHLTDLAYLVDLLDRAWTEQERVDARSAIDAKVRQIDSVFIKWTGQSSTPIPLSGDYRGGGWGTVDLSGGSGGMSGHYTGTYDKSAKGTIDLSWRNGIWTGTWREPKIGREGRLFDITVADEGTTISGKWDVTKEGGKGFTESTFSWTWSKN